MPWVRCPHGQCHDVRLGEKLLKQTYEAVRAGPGWNETASMHARIHACKCFKQVMDNGLRLLMIEPLERM